MNEKQRKRLNFLQTVAHDNAIHMRTSKACGKLVPDLNSVATIFDILEEIIQACLVE